MELLTSQQIEKCWTAPELAERALSEIDSFLGSAADLHLHSPVELRAAFQDVSTQQTKALVQQVRHVGAYDRLNVRRQLHA